MSWRGRRRRPAAPAAELPARRRRQNACGRRPRTPGSARPAPTASLHRSALPACRGRALALHGESGAHHSGDPARRAASAAQSRQPAAPGRPRERPAPPTRKPRPSSFIARSAAVRRWRSCQRDFCKNVPRLGRRAARRAAPLLPDFDDAELVTPLTSARSVSEGCSPCGAAWSRTHTAVGVFHTSILLHALCAEPALFAICVAADGAVAFLPTASAAPRRGARRRARRAAVRAGRRRRAPRSARRRCSTRRCSARCCSRTAAGSPARAPRSLPPRSCCPTPSGPCRRPRRSGARRRRGGVRRPAARGRAVARRVRRGVRAVARALRGARAGPPARGLADAVHGAWARGDGQRPGVGLWWCLLAQVFPASRAHFVFALHVLPRLCLLPLAAPPPLPLLCAALSFGVVTAFKPHLAMPDVVLALALLGTQLDASRSATRGRRSSPPARRCSSARSRAARCCEGGSAPARSTPTLRSPRRCSWASRRARHCWRDCSRGGKGPGRRQRGARRGSSARGGGGGGSGSRQVGGGFAPNCAALPYSSASGPIQKALNSSPRCSRTNSARIVAGRAEVPPSTSFSLTMRVRAASSSSQVPSCGGGRATRRVQDDGGSGSGLSRYIIV